MYNLKTLDDFYKLSTKDKLLVMFENVTAITFEIDDEEYTLFEDGLELYCVTTDKTITEFKNIDEVLNYKIKGKSMKDIVEEIEVYFT